MESLKLQCLRFRILLLRLLQAAAALYGICAVYAAPYFCVFTVVLLLRTQFYFVSLLYIVWFIYDSNTSNCGGRRWEWLRNWKMWTYACEYFPIRMIKTCDLPPTRNYLMCYHPHGIACAGSFACFATEAANFKKEFPGLTARLLVQNSLLWAPLLREHILGTGCYSVKKESIDYLLSRKRTGNASCLIVGGAAETFEAHPGTATLILKKRKGFIKLALKHGASLVPMFAFGENNIFRQLANPNGSRLRYLQSKVAKLINFSHPFFFGRWGTLLPYRTPITVVIGKPIDLEVETEPSQERINAIQERYIKELKTLFETHKSKYDPNLQLNII